MKPTTKRQLEQPQMNEHNHLLAKATTGALRRHFGRTLLVGLPLAGAALATGGAETAQAAAASDAWKLGGNTVGVNDGSLFLGSRDNTHLVLKTNNLERMRIVQDGRVGIGTSDPAAQLGVFSRTATTLRAETMAKGAVGVLGLGSTPGALAGVVGGHLGGGTGVLGTSDESLGTALVQGIGVEGRASGVAKIGVKGSTDGDNGVGVVGEARGKYGVGVSAHANAQYSSAFRAEADGDSHSAVLAVLQAPSGWALNGIARAEIGNGIGVLGQATSPTAYAGFFEGRVHVNGTLSKSGGSFKIDHPLDPANKYLSHSFVESPDMLNIYNGNVTLDAQGTAVVDLPAYFDALNMELRYQLTAIGAPGPDLHIAEEIAGNRFVIAGGRAGMKVSWQVTGIRRDAYAQAHRIPVEEDKPAEERGRFLHPCEHGQPAERGLLRRSMSSE